MHVVLLFSCFGLSRDLLFSDSRLFPLPSWSACFHPYQAPPGQYIFHRSAGLNEVAATRAQAEALEASLQVVVRQLEHRSVALGGNSLVVSPPGFAPVSYSLCLFHYRQGGGFLVHGETTAISDRAIGPRGLR